MGAIRPHGDVQVGLTPEQEEAAWQLYEQSGNMAEVARQLKVHYHHVYAAFNRDPLRLHDINKVRADASAARWEALDHGSTTLQHRVLKMMDRVLSHIEACEEAGCETDLLTSEGDKMTPMQAMQWVMSSRQLDPVHKTGFAAARISAELRMVAMHGPAGRKAADGGRDPSTMSDAELLALAKDLQSQGRELPHGVAQYIKRLTEK